MAMDNDVIGDTVEPICVMTGGNYKLELASQSFFWFRDGQFMIPQSIHASM